jgi:hypothetical protein
MQREMNLIVFCIDRAIRMGGEYDILISSKSPRRMRAEMNVVILKRIIQEDVKCNIEASHLFQ